METFVDLIIRIIISAIARMTKPNGFGDICEKLWSVPYVLFLVMAAMFFHRPKINISALCRIPLGTFVPNLVQIGPVVSEEKNFERNNNKIGKKV